ncbi:MAG: pyruvate kinase [Gallionella sp.]|nr:pyruvate kinase [Gallionella sp.]
MRHTRIVCTIGPASLQNSTLLALYDAGLSVARLNGSHADLDWHRAAIKKIHDILPEVPILLDIPGRKIRTIQLLHEPSFSVGDTLVLTTDLSHDGREKVPVNYSNLHDDLSVGDTILADDGTLRFTVTGIEGRDIYCRVETSGQLKSRKGINVPFVCLNTPQVTPRDEQMIAFACDNKVDFIGLSFVESAAHIMAFRKIINGSSPRIVAKVENQGGMDLVHEIVEAADAIMIDRGDLSVETSLYDVAIKQKLIIEAARRHGRPVIVATEMLHTMIQNSFPTKAEVSDITNAVLDGCAATMLSGETAIGHFALEAVKTMRHVIDATEKHFQSEMDRASVSYGANVPEVMSCVIPTICRSLPITKVVAVTRSGFAARMIAAHRLRQPILAVSDDAAAARSFNLIAGTKGVFSGVPFSRHSADHIMDVLKMLWERGLIFGNDLVLVTGVSYPTPGSRMNTIQIYNIGDLVNTFAWSSSHQSVSREKI